MHKKTLAKPTEALLETLTTESWLSDFYLAGGTALALQLGHRVSVDLDFFSDHTFNEVTLIENLSSVGQLEIFSRSDRSLTGTLKKVKVSFLGYRYPVLEPFKDFNGVRLASVTDIACMKLDALSSRGTKRDFVDLYFITKAMPLPHIIEAFEKKYAGILYNPLHIKKSLAYFEDAESDPMPLMLVQVTWEEVKSFFLKESTRL